MQLSKYFLRNRFGCSYIRTSLLTHSITWSIRRPNNGYNFEKVIMSVILQYLCNNCNRIWWYLWYVLVLKSQVPWSGACFCNWRNAQFYVKFGESEFFFNSHSRSAWIYRTLEVHGSQVKSPRAYCHRRSLFKEIINWMNTSSHGGEGSLALDLPAPTEIRCARTSVHKESTCFLCLCNHDALSHWRVSEKSETVLSPDLTPYVEGIVAGTKPARGNGNLIPLTSSKK